jgi:transitional endoplasmic reticulum ATPase
MIYVPAPDEKARLQIFKLYTKNMPLTKDVDLQNLAKVTKGYSGADIESLCREAAINALRRDIEAKEVTPEDFKKVLEKTGPTITPEMESWYQTIAQQFRKAEKAIPTPIA